MATVMRRGRRRATPGPEAPEAATARRSRRVPRELVLLLIVVALAGFTWALVSPPWGAPDEDVHFAYTQTLAERHELPGRGPQEVSSEQRFSMDVLNTDQVVFFQTAKPDWSEAGERSWREGQKPVPRSDGGGANAASDYPPAYYLYELLPYELAGSKSDIITRLYVMRMFSVMWLLVTTVGAWLLAGEMLGRNRPLQLVTAATIGLWPMLTFMSSSINPDSMLVAMYTLAAWLGVSILRRGLTLKRAAGLCLVTGLALVAKATALALLPPVGFALAVAAWRARRKLSARGLAWAGAAAAAFGVPVLAWVLVARGAGHAAYGQAALVTPGGSDAASGATGSTPGTPAVVPSGSIRFFASYLWQFYLPKLPFMRDQRFVFSVISPYPAYQVWLASGWASFGWVNIWFPPWVYRVFLGVALAVLGGAAVTLARGVKALRAAGGVLRKAPWALIIFLALTVGTLLAGLHWTDFHMRVDGKAPFIQGRYMLPVGALFALVVAAAVKALPARFRTIGIGCVLGGLVALQIACLALVVTRYYA
jgi:4-amino-4-deoxy-L-arabinose transferase-like glycosyltransferase